MRRGMFVLVVILAVAAGAFATGEAEVSSETPVITILTSGVGDLPAKENDVILQALQEKLGIEIERTALASDYAQQLNIRIAGGNTPDLFQADTRNQLVNIVGQDVALELDPYLSEMPNIEDWYTETDYQKGRVDGVLYALARRPYARYSTFLIRQDWLDAVGMAMPATIDEFRDVAVAFTSQDPDGNGRNDTLGLTGFEGIASFKPIFGAFGTTFDGNWMIRDGGVVYSTVDPRYREAIAWIRDFIGTGAVDPELLANKSQADMNKTFNGQIGINYRNLWEYYKPEYASQIEAVNPDADWVQMPAIQGPYGSADREWDVAVMGSLNVLSADLADDFESRDAVLRLLDYVTDGEGQRLVLYGIEGEHFTWDGTAVTINQDRVSEVTYAHNWQFTGRDELLYLSTKYPWSLGYLQFVADQPVINIYNGLVGLPEGVNFADKERYEDEEIAKFMYGIRPMSEWDDFVQTLYETFDLQAYIDKAETDLAAAGYID